MADESQTTGTPGTSGEGGNATATGTPPVSTEGGNAGALNADERAELERLKRVQEQALAEKSNYERLKQENEQLSAQTMAGRGYPPPTAYDPAAIRAQQLATVLQNVQERDPETAALILESDRLAQERIAKVETESRFYRELGGVPDADRQEAERISRTYNLWPSQAYNQIKAERYDKERANLAEQSRKVQEERDRLGRNVVRTTAEPSLSTPRGDEITGDDYDKIISDARKGDKGARKKLDDVESGKISVRYG